MIAGKDITAAVSEWKPQYERKIEEANQPPETPVIKPFTTIDLKFETDDKSIVVNPKKADVEGLSVEWVTGADAIDGSGSLRINVTPETNDGDKIDAAITGESVEVLPWHTYTISFQYRVSEIQGSYYIGIMDTQKKNTKCWNSRRPPPERCRSSPTSTRRSAPTPILWYSLSAVKERAQSRSTTSMWPKNDHRGDGVTSFFEKGVPRHSGTPIREWIPEKRKKSGSLRIIAGLQRTRVLPCIFGRAASRSALASIRAHSASATRPKRSAGSPRSCAARSYRWVIPSNQWGVWSAVTNRPAGRRW